MNVAISWTGLTESHARLSEHEITSWRSLPALQQPDWPDDWLLAEVTRDLATLPELIDADETEALRLLLGEVAEGRRQVIQAGDCAEDPADCAPGPLTRKVGLLDALAGVMRVGTGLPVIRVGRIAGQFGKPRSSPTERVDGTELPVYRGHLVNGPQATAESRRPDPLRLLACHEAAGAATAFLRKQQDGFGAPVWTSHEALVLDYEVPQLRRDTDGRLLLTSTHWPWIGDRTRRPDGAHVRLLAAVNNPVACKVGPGMTEDELLRLCEVLDPARQPGRLTLIARTGAGRAAGHLHRLAARVRSAGHPVVWLCDPMHGNTVRATNGRKTRLLSSVTQEVREFREVLGDLGLHPGGLHLEATPDHVAECLPDASQLDYCDGPYTTLCDPRLNMRQALAVAESWNREEQEEREESVPCP
ncbi:3-deoxy-7-phosphoheptulonate synthase [Streptomyces sp. NPDC001401]|uniref:3-deoxy-7-phosphoheptulonate synthase n=1 Tax=Streptomyces sp. NPDC001401 TaxID=3364570 RepID=UPI0036C17FAC